MTYRAVDEDTISINSKLYRLNGKVRQFLASQRPGKITIGDYTDASNPLASELSWDDFRDGIGVEIADLRTDQNRAWFATTQLRYKGRVILPTRAVTTAAASTAADIDVLVEFKSEIYATHSTAVHIYDNTTDSWGSSVRTLANDATDARAGILYPSDTPTETLAIATGSEVDYTTDGASWARQSGQSIKYLEFFSDLLWGITNAGRLYYTDDLSEAWSEDAMLQLPAGYVTGLVVARGPDREQHLYATTKVGIYVHDRANARFLPTDLKLPFHPQGGRGNAVWRGSIYTSAGTSIYQFKAGSDQTAVDVVGPDRDHGLPASKRGTIAALEGSHNDLLALLDASDAAGVTGLTTRVTRGVRFHHGVTFSSSTGFSLILGWNERGWEVKWQSGANDRGISAAVVSNAYNTYRLWWAQNQRVYFMQLPVDVVNPLQVTDSEYATSGTLETPWVDMGIRNQKKLALSVIVETVNPSSSETVQVEYATDYDETSYTTIATQSTTGETEYMLPSSSDVKGVTFRSWKFRVTLSRGSTVTNTPQLVKLTLVWRPRVKALYGFSADIDLTEPFGGRTPKQLLADLRSALNSDTLFEMTYRDDDTENQNYFVDMLDLQTAEDGGQVDYGIARVIMAEPRQTRGR